MSQSSRRWVWAEGWGQPFRLGINPNAGELVVEVVMTQQWPSRSVFKMLAVSGCGESGELVDGSNLWTSAPRTAPENSRIHSFSVPALKMCHFFLFSLTWWVQFYPAFVLFVFGELLPFSKIMCNFYEKILVTNNDAQSTTKTPLFNVNVIQSQLQKN